MGEIHEGIAAAEAEAPTGIGAMKSTLMVGIVKGTTTVRGITKVEARGIGAQALATAEGEAEAGALVEGGIVALSGKAVRRDVPKLSSGTRKGNSKKKLRMLIRMVATVTMKTSIMGICKIVMNTSVTSSDSSKEAMNTDLFSSIWFVFSH